MRVGKVTPYRGALSGKTMWRGQVELLFDDGEWFCTIECNLIEGSQGPFLGMPSRKVPSKTGGADEYMQQVRMSNRGQAPLIAAIQQTLGQTASTAAQPQAATSEPTQQDEFAKAEAEFGAGF